MSQEDTIQILSYYYSAVESYEGVIALFYEGNGNSVNIVSGLQNCCSKIDDIILGEDKNCIFLVSLYQLKQHALDLINFLKKEIEKQIRLNNIDMEKPIQSDSNKTTDKEQQQLEKVVEATIESPRIKGFKEVAGLCEVKKILKSLVLLPKNQPQLFENRKIFNSILFFGPPGTGKTQLVHALAYDAQAVLFSISSGNILSPFVGQAEKNIKFLFDYIKRKDGFSLLFIDEVDGFCRKRSSSEQDFSRRIKTELLCQMNKMETNPNFFLIAATNCPWDLDTAFLRRFQKRVYIPLPTYTERRDLFKLFANNTPLEHTFSNWEYLISQTEGFSGSDISSLVQQALNTPIMELQDIKIWKCSRDGCYEPIMQSDDFNIEDIVCSELNDLPPCSVRARVVQPVDLVNALSNINPTTTKDDIEKFEIFVKE